MNEVPYTIPAGEIVAHDVAAEDYMDKYAASRHEWVRGYVIKMTPVSLRHKRLTQYLDRLLAAYFAQRPIGEVLGEPYVLKLTDSRREPDLVVVLHTGQATLTETAVVGPADICIEIISPESVARDYGEKFAEYEAAGVREYWTIDPQRELARFHRLNQVYTDVALDADGAYRTPLLPGLALPVATLWQDPLPNIEATLAMVKAMLNPPA